MTCCDRNSNAPDSDLSNLQAGDFVRVIRQNSGGELPVGSIHRVIIRFSEATVRSDNRDWLVCSGIHHVFERVITGVQAEVGDTIQCLIAGDVSFGARMKVREVGPNTLRVDGYRLWPFPEGYTIVEKAAPKVENPAEPPPDKALAWLKANPKLRYTIGSHGYTDALRHMLEDVYGLKVTEVQRESSIEFIPINRT